MRKIVEQLRQAASDTDDDWIGMRCLKAADTIDALVQAVKRAQHYMRNCGVNMERDYPEIDAALARAEARS